MTAPDTDTLIAVVKPLEWHRVTYGWLTFEEWYRIEDQGRNWPTERYWLYERGERLGKFDTFKQADAVMFARHEKRILSALSLDVCALAEERDRLREALAEAIEFADQDAQALTPAGIALVGRWRRALSA